MKKSLYVVLILTSAQAALCMDKGNEHLPAQDSGFGIFAFAGNVTNWFTHTITEIDNAFSGQAHENEEVVIEDSNTKLVQNILGSNKDLNLELKNAASADNPTNFIAILRGMHNLGLRTENAEVEKVVKLRLNHLQLERRQVTQELLEKRRVQEQQIHVLRKIWAPQDTHSDDESYEDSVKFAQKSLTHE